MRTITCLFFAVATLMLGNIRAFAGAAIGQGSDVLPAVAALVFLIAAAIFAVLDWPGFPTRDVAAGFTGGHPPERPSAR